MAKQIKNCDIDGCNRCSCARGWCEAHYRRWLKYGNPLSGQKTMRGDLLKFMNKTLHYVRDDCLIWPYAKNANGYAQIKIKGKNFRVSRLICEKVNGPSPTDKHDAAHSCGNGHLSCINPKHLRWATRKENMRDCIKHGTTNKGTRNGKAKLSVDDIIKIRESISISQRTLAKQFGVSQTQISMIRSNKCWTELV